LKFHTLWDSSLVKIKRGRARLDQQSTKTNSGELDQILFGANLVEI